MHVYDLNDGAGFVKAARISIELFITDKLFNKDIVRTTLQDYERPHGVFVTLEHYPTRELRGCIGFPRAIAPLKESIVDAAIAAAFEDPRYISVSKSEIDELLIEVSILSSPVLVRGGKRARLLNGIKVPGNGLIVEYGLHSGLLLPKVAVEQKWSKRRFLEEVCIKAGIHKNYWTQPNVKLYKFEAQVFREESPNGKVIEVKY